MIVKGKYVAVKTEREAIDILETTTTKLPYTGYKETLITKEVGN